MYGVLAPHGDSDDDWPVHRVSTLIIHTPCISGGYRPFHARIRVLLRLKEHLEKKTENNSIFGMGSRNLFYPSSFHSLNS